MSRASLTAGVSSIMSTDQSYGAGDRRTCYATGHGQLFLLGIHCVIVTIIGIQTLLWLGG